MTNEEAVKRAFAAAFNLPDDYDVRSVKYGEVPFWDSTAHMVLIAELEDAFDIMLSTDDVLRLSSYQRAVEIVDASLRSRPAVETVL
jgi:acyl carrier protein